MVKLIRRRYIAFQLMPRTNISKRKIYEALTRNFSVSNNGRGEGQRHIRVIDYDAETGLGIIRCGHKSIGQLLHSIREAKGVLAELNMRTTGTSGTIKTLKRKFFPKVFK